MSILVPVNPTEAQIERENKVLATLTTWLEAVPTSGEDGLLAILEQIIAVEDPNMLDAAWNTAGFGDWLGWALTLSNPRKAASKLAGGLPWFLIVDAVVKDTRQRLTLTTSATAIMAQILLANAKGFLPMDFVPLEKDEPTENGFYPQHLKVWKSYMPTAPDPTSPKHRISQAAQMGPEATARIRERIKANREPVPAPAAFDVPETPEF